MPKAKVRRKPRKKKKCEHIFHPEDNLCMECGISWGSMSLYAKHDYLKRMLKAVEWSKEPEAWK